MIACLRSANFQYPDRTAQCDNKEFIVTQRFTRLSGVVMRKAWGTYREAVRDWDEKVTKLTDTGLERRDAKIIGFREEG
jgi:hypothetical protein